MSMSIWRLHDRGHTMSPEFERLWQLGLGGIVAILLIREVLTYLKTLKSTRNGQKAAGDMTP